MVNSYWRLRKKRPITIKDTTATFYTGTMPEAVAVNYLYKTESEMLDDLLNEVHCEDTVFDIGANFGLYSCLASKRTNQRVVSIEPYPPNIPRLRRNFNINNIKPDLIKVTLGANSGMVAFDSPSIIKKYSGRSSVKEDTSSDKFKVPMKRGDELVSDSNIPTPSIIKIDTEGNELNTLLGLENTLSTNKCRLVYCEVHFPASGVGIENQSENRKALEILKSHGFKVTVLKEFKDRVHIKAKSNV